MIRAIQNAIQLKAINSDDGMRKQAYEEFIESLHQTDKEFLCKMLKDLGSDNNG